MFPLNKIRVIALLTLISYTWSLDSVAITNEGPKIEDLKIFLPVLRKIVDHNFNNQDSLYLDLVFGLFCINVNVKLVTRFLEIPQDVKTEMIDLVKTNIKTLTNFYNKIKYYVIPGNNRYKKRDKIITTMIWNETAWMQRLLNFDPLPLSQYQEEQYRIQTLFQSNNLEKLYTEGVPNSEVSDRCIASLKVTTRQMDGTVSCSMDHDCYAILTNGTNVGYFLTHRLLWILLARYGRGCSILSPSSDRELASHLCSSAYAEAEHLISSGLLNTMHTIDILLEQMALCALDGHEQFLKRAWLMEGLKYQREDGCFSNFNVQNPEHQMRRLFEVEKLGTNRCSHVTAVAAIVYSSAVRLCVNPTTK